jgi:anti-anti-sigma factor
MQSATIESATPDEPFAVIQVTGELDLDTQDSFEAEVLQRLKGGSVVIDLSRLEFLAISSLRALISCELSAHEERHRVVYADPPQQARRLLEVAGLDQVLSLSATLAGANVLVARR